MGTKAFIKKMTRVSAAVLAGIWAAWSRISTSWYPIRLLGSLTNAAMNRSPSPSGGAAACVAAGKHTFFEKQVAVDAPGAGHVITMSKLAAQKKHGEVQVNTQIVGFKKVRFYTLENVGAGNLSMPEQEMHTTAFWLHFPAQFMAKFSGLTPAAKALFIASTLAHDATAIVVVPTDADVEQTVSDIRFFLSAIEGLSGAAADRQVLPFMSHEVDPYRGLSPHPEISAARAKARWPSKKAPSIALWVGLNSRDFLRPRKCMS